MIKHFKKLGLTNFEAMQLLIPYNKLSPEYKLSEILITSAWRRCMCESIDGQSLEIVLKSFNLNKFHFSKCLPCNCRDFIIESLKTRQPIETVDLLEFMSDVVKVQTGCLCHKLNSQCGVCKVKEAISSAANQVNVDS